MTQSKRKGGLKRKSASFSDFLRRLLRHFGNDFASIVERVPGAMCVLCCATHVPLVRGSACTPKLYVCIHSQIDGRPPPPHTHPPWSRGRRSPIRVCPALLVPAARPLTAQRTSWRNVKSRAKSRSAECDRILRARFRVGVKTGKESNRESAPQFVQNERVACAWEGLRPHPPGPSIYRSSVW